MHRAFNCMCSIQSCDTALQGHVNKIENAEALRDPFNIAAKPLASLLKDHN